MAGLMKNFKRYAIYYAPEPGALATFGAQWLGWDALSGAPVTHPNLPGLPLPVSEITETPRKYGFHATLKPPFHLSEGFDAGRLHTETQTLARQLAPVTLQGLQLSQLGHFLALTPLGDVAALAALACDVVQVLDPFRAPPSPAELARRRPESLTAPQRALLRRWGYPYVLDEFRFHLTLSGRLSQERAALVKDVLMPIITPILPEPFTLNSICLFGEDQDGMFHQLHRYALTG